MLGRMVHEVLKKNWSREDVDNLIGEYKSAYISHARDDSIRLGGASGGTVTALLSAALSSHMIDGALVCGTKIERSRVRTFFYIATAPGDLKRSQGSKYVQTNFIKEAFTLIDDFDGRLAVVGLPCNITALKTRMGKRPALAEKIVFTVSLFCFHSSREELVDRYISRFAPWPGANLERFRFKIGLWRGKTIARFENDFVLEKKFSSFGLYQNLHFFSQRKCFNCIDHFGYDSDVCAGDIWSYHLKRANKKHNSIIVKTDAGEKIMEEARTNGHLHMEEISIEDVLDGQSRAAPFHYNISARHKAGKLFGMHIPDKVGKKVRRHEYLTAVIALFNWKWSQHRLFSGLIFRAPESVMKLYQYFYKGLESFK